MASGGSAGIEDGEAGMFSVPEAITGWIDGDGGVDGSVAAGADPAGKLTGGAALDVAAARGDGMAAAATAALGETFPAAVTRFGAVVRGRAVVVRRIVFF